MSGVGTVAEGRAAKARLPERSIVGSRANSPAERESRYCPHESHFTLDDECVRVCLATSAYLARTTFRYSDKTSVQKGN